MKKLMMGVLAVLCAGSSMATVIFQDNFENHAGALHNRRPDSWDTTYSQLAYWKNEALNFQVTNGVLMTTAPSGLASAWLTMPTISSGDLIRVSAVFVANVSASTKYVSMGLLQSKNHTYQRGEPWITMTRRPTAPGADLGLLIAYGGLGNTQPALVSANNLKEAQGFTTNLNARNVATYEYDTASGNLSVWLTSEGGTTVTQYVGSVNYGGVAGAVVPVDEINYFGITFYDATPFGSSDPAYIDDLSVDITFAPVQEDPLLPANIVGWSAVSSNLMRMVVDAQSAASNYYPKSTADLVAGTWADIAHSDDGVNAFVVTNLVYATAEGTNKVIYVEANAAAGFFGIGGQ